MRRYRANALGVVGTRASGGRERDDRGGGGGGGLSRVFGDDRSRGRRRRRRRRQFAPHARRERLRGRVIEQRRRGERHVERFGHLRARVDGGERVQPRVHERFIRGDVPASERRDDGTNGVENVPEGDSNRRGVGVNVVPVHIYTRRIRSSHQKSSSLIDRTRIRTDVVVVEDVLQEPRDVGAGSSRRDDGPIRPRRARHRGESNAIPGVRFPNPHITRSHA